MGPALVAAAARGDRAEVERLLAAGAHVDARDARGRTAVMAAAYGHHTDTVAVLVAAGADANLRDDDRATPFLHAGAQGWIDVLEVVAPVSDPTVRNRYGGVALIPACERGHVATVRWLLEHTAVEVDHVNDLGWTALLEAIVLSDGGPEHEAIVALLLEHGADPDLPDGEGLTPLARARERGQHGTAALLERAGARA